MFDIHSIFICLNYISVFIMLLCFIIIAHQKSSKMQKHALVVCVSLLITCIGYLFRIQATSVEGLIIGQKLLYSFVPFGMLYMLLFILDYCGYHLNKTVKKAFTALNCIITVVVLTLDYHQLFYKSYWSVVENGYLTLEKEYGIFHTITVVLFAVYMASAVVIAIIYSINNAKKRRYYVWRLLLAVSLPCLSYVIPKLLDMKNDLQPIAFAVFTLVVLIMIYQDGLYDVKNIIAQLSLASSDEGVIVLDNKNHYKGSNEFAQNLFPQLSELLLDEKINTVPGTLGDLINERSNEYKTDDYIYAVSNSVVKNSDNLTIGKVFRIKDVTMERKYTELLQNQVTALSIISKKDELSGCFNRRRYEEVVSEIRERGTIKGVHVWAMDVNHLRETNNTLGHAAGDEIIVAAAGIIKSVFNDYGDVFRTGGDEFFAILQKDGVDNEALASRLNKLCANWKGNLSSSLTISYGYVVGDDWPDKNIDQILICADKEMYKNKREYYKEKGIDRRTNR